MMAVLLTASALHGFERYAPHHNVRHINEKGEIAMKTGFLSLMALIVLMVSGCAGTTPIKNLALPPVSTIEGNITQLDESGFTLKDNSGSIHVRAKLSDNKKLDLSICEKVKVYGNLQGGQEKNI
jgi:hypothetical protein